MVGIHRLGVWDCERKIVILSPFVALSVSLTGKASLLQISIAWGTAPGADDVIAWTNLGLTHACGVNGTNCSQSTLTLAADLVVSMSMTCLENETSLNVVNSTNQAACEASNHTWVEKRLQQYFASLMVVNGAGLVRNVSTDGVVVDRSPPRMLHANEGLFGDVDNQAYTNLILGNWLAEDNESSVFYEFRVLDESDRPITNYSWARENEIFGCKVDPELEVGGTYRFQVRGVNEAGNTGTAAISDGIRVGTSEVKVDPTKPTGMMFDAMPAQVNDACDVNATNCTQGPMTPAATSETPLVGSFAAPPGAIQEGVTMMAGKVGDDGEYGEGQVDPEEKMPSGMQFGDYSFEIGSKIVMLSRFVALLVSLTLKTSPLQWPMRTAQRLTASFSISRPSSASHTSQTRCSATLSRTPKKPRASPCSCCSTFTASRGLTRKTPVLRLVLMSHSPGLSWTR